MKGNKFSAEGTIGVVDTGSGCVEKLDFEGNDLLDTKVDFVANNLRYVNVTDNTLTFSLPASRPFYAIQLGELHDSGHGIVERSMIEGNACGARAYRKEDHGAKVSSSFLLANQGFKIAPRSRGGPALCEYDLRAS
jgi:hypothetical protein